ncbi:hypothetical protein DFH08DRAFT_455185 [Mycena albidolilacea]|uniref:Uncharacterized protein n=1 Tax=Mycena albidolilacea TaxID=1033008 RepID=A0AAD6Z7S3_9AGAR|nr:hypothetical protein DFH08DRAFT_455185 [Mycena albidolilacea]
MGENTRVTTAFTLYRLPLLPPASQRAANTTSSIPRMRQSRPPRHPVLLPLLPPPLVRGRVRILCPSKSKRVLPRKEVETGCATDHDHDEVGVGCANRADVEVRTGCENGSAVELDVDAHAHSAPSACRMLASCAMSWRCAGLGVGVWGVCGQGNGSIDVWMEEEGEGEVVQVQVKSRRSRKNVEAEKEGRRKCGGGRKVLSCGTSGEWA